MTSPILVENRDGIAVVTLNRPEKRNSLRFSDQVLLRDELSELEADNSVKAVVLYGAGGAFCSGSDLSELADATAGERTKGVAVDFDQDMPWLVTRFSKPVVGAVDGAAVGLGAEIATHCDVRIVTPRTRIAWNFVHRGLVPDTGAGTWLLPRLVGLPTALRWLMSGEFIGAAELVRTRLAATVTEPGDLVEAAVAEARSLSQGSPLATRLTKALLYGATGGDLAQHIERHVMAFNIMTASDDHQEGVASFLERRSPRFTGK